MNVEETTLPGVLVLSPTVYRDARGYFVTTYQQALFEDVGITQPFVQHNQSRSARNTIRGLHYQYPHDQGKLVRIVDGAVYDVVVDIRQGSPTYGRSIGVELSAENHRLLWVPPGLAHGFCTLSDCAVMVYECTDFYAPDCEHTVLWNDPELNIDWPADNPILSDKDRRGVPLRDIPSTDLPHFN